MALFKHVYMILATDFELEPVIEQYLATYPEAKPRNYQVVCKLQDEQHKGDYCYIIVYKFMGGRQKPNITEFIKSYCQVHDKVVTITQKNATFPDLTNATYGNRSKYQKRK